MAELLLLSGAPDYEAQLAGMNLRLEYFHDAAQPVSSSGAPPRQRSAERGREQTTTSDGMAGSCVTA